jgi:hypothetical protein
MAADCQHGLSACPCAGTCDCLPRSPVVIKTRPGLLARLRRWWKLRPLREQEAGLRDDRLALGAEIEALMAKQWTSGPTKARSAAIEVRRLELLDLDRRINVVRADIARLS